MTAETKIYICDGLLFVFNAGQWLTKNSDNSTPFWVLTALFATTLLFWIWIYFTVRASKQL